MSDYTKELELIGEILEKIKKVERVTQDFIKMMESNTKHANHPLTKVFNEDAGAITKVFEAIIETPEYQAMLKDSIKPEEPVDGWIKHTGNKQPVDDNVMVVVSFEGAIMQPRKASFWKAEWDSELSDDELLTEYRIVPQEDKPECSLCHHNEIEFEGAICPRCQNKPKKTEKQTLLEYAEGNEEDGLNGLTPAGIIDLISEYLEQGSK